MKRIESQTIRVGDLHAPGQAMAVLNRSCMDCHSSKTAWPWYSYVAPMSWLVENDVRRGRERMNFSDWDQYTFKEREKLLADIGTAVKNHEMPLPQYTLVHRRAKLSDAETDILYQWARAERRRLRAVVAAIPTSAGQQKSRITSSGRE